MRDDTVRKAIIALDLTNGTWEKKNVWEMAPDQQEILVDAYWEIYNANPDLGVRRIRAVSTTLLMPSFLAFVDDVKDVARKV